ncbi:dockerin type I repeat-containing protein [Ruminococcus albus]|uniref:dockerin type I repeat-containing protein n=1 Tax=Ruminococcus albus TaxID=1264 RepID=UPI000467A661|nr:dockerin type I repeat-containing protein [Ruminococcus albus]
MTKTIKKAAAALLALALAAGTIPAEFGARGSFTVTASAETEEVTEVGNEKEEPDEPVIAPNTFFTVAEFEAAEPGSNPTLVLQDNIYGPIIITRDDGVIDLNGFSINGYLNLQNKNGILIVKNGSVDCIDDTSGPCYEYTYPVILINVTVRNVIFGGNRKFYYLGNTTVRTFATESGTYEPADSTGFNAYADPVAKEGLVYNGEPQLLIDDSSFKGTFGVVPTADEEQRYFTYYFTRGEQESDTYEAGTVEDGVINAECAPLYAADAGEYTVYYMWDCDGEFDGGTGNNSFTVTIDKAVPEVTAPTANELTYNGEAQELVTAGSSTFGKLSYSLDGETYSEEIPTATAAGKYTVWYKVEETSNWESSEVGSLEVTIDHLYTKHEKADATCTEDGAKEVYWTNELGEFFSDDKGENEIDSSVVIPAKGHDYDTEAPVWTWTKSENGFDVGIQFKCKTCGDTEDIKAEVSSKDDGKQTTYTAIAVFDEKTYTDTKIFDDTYTVTVKGGTIADGEKEVYLYDDKIVIEAEDTPAFAGWYIGAELVSTEQAYCLTVTGDTEIEAKYDENFILGDVNSDGKININDLSKAAAHVKGKRMLTDDQIRRADINRDGSVNVTDIIRIAAHIKGKKLIVNDR